MEQHTPRHFVMQLGSLISLYLSLGFFITLVFGYINLRFPDSIDTIWEIEQAASSIRLGFAMVVVFFPTYLVLTRFVNKNRRENKDASYLTLTKWLIYLSLLVAGIVLLSDLVAVILGFLEGELTLRFILKAAAVFLLTGMAFYYYIQDARGYWIENEKKSRTYALITGIIVFGILIASVATIQTPSQVREMKVDTQMVGDLQDMQWRIEDYFRANQSLPVELSAVYGSFEQPKPPADKPAYQYNLTSDTTYELCADFTHDMSGPSPKYAPTMDSVAPGVPGNYNWDYKAGYWCFKRVVDNEYRQ